MADTVPACKGGFFLARRGKSCYDGRKLPVGGRTDESEGAKRAAAAVQAGPHRHQQGIRLLCQQQPPDHLLCGRAAGPAVPGGAGDVSEPAEKTLSGALGRNLIDIVFSTAQVADSDEHRLLQTLRQTELQDANARESLYRRIIDAIDMGESSYLILLAADTYDVPHRSRDDLEVPDASETVFRYFVCAICPVKDPTLALQYSDRDKEFRGSSTGHIAQPPALGFLFPAFDDRAANIYNALFYSKDTAQLHQEVIDAVFCVQEAPMSPQEQQNVFTSALTETLEKDCSYDVVQAVHEQLRGRIQEHKESRDPEPLTLSVREVGDVLTGSGVPEEKVEAFQDQCRRQYGQDAALNPRNIIEAGKFQITTPEVKITVPPEYSYMVEARIIDGRRFILIPADDGVEVNGIAVTIPNPQE